MVAKKKRGGLLIGILILLLIAAGSGGGVWYFYREVDTDENIRASQSDLRLIWRGIREFQSEGYFARPPKTLEDLYHYRFKSYLPKPAPKDMPSPGYTEVVREYSLIPDLLTFINPVSGKIPQKGHFVSDYTLVNGYEPFMPDDAVIAWDNPGNFATGGNLLFYNGRVEFIKMQPAEYKRFTKAIQTRSDREFVRKICREASVSGFKKDPEGE